MNFNSTRSFAVVISLCLISQPVFADPPRRITIDGNFADWADVPAYKDAAHNEHDTSHNKRDDMPAHVEHTDVDILEYKLAHDDENLYAYFKARGVIGRTQIGGKGKPAGRYYAIVTIDLDQNEKTGYWLHEVASTPPAAATMSMRKSSSTTDGSTPATISITLAEIRRS